MQKKMSLSSACQTALLEDCLFQPIIFSTPCFYESTTAPVLVEFAQLTFLSYVTLIGLNLYADV